MVLTMRVLANRVARLDGVARTVHVLSGRRPSLLGSGWLCYRVVFGDLVDVDVEFEELLPDEVLDEPVVVHQFLIIHFSPTLKLHLLVVKLPLDLDLYQGMADDSEHVLRVSLELEPNVECALLKDL